MKMIILFSILLLASCSIGKRPDTEIYTLKTEDNAFASKNCSSKLSIQINDPNAAAGLETRRIAVAEGENKLNYYQNIRWSSTAPEIFGDILIDSFEQAKVFTSTSTEANSLHSDLILLTDLRNFEVVDKSTGEVRLRLISKLIRAKNRQVLKTIEVEKKFAPKANNTDEIITAFNQVSLDAAHEIINQVTATKAICK